MKMISGSRGFFAHFWNRAAILFAIYEGNKPRAKQQTESKQYLILRTIFPIHFVVFSRRNRFIHLMETMFPFSLHSSPSLSEAVKERHRLFNIAKKKRILHHNLASNQAKFSFKRRKYFSVYIARSTLNQTHTSCGSADSFVQKFELKASSLVGRVCRILGL